MCWSWQVSLAFALVQWTIIGYLWYRNKFMDRLLAVAQMFIAIQESLQFVLWAFAINESTTDRSCSALNTVSSYGLLFDVTSIIPAYGIIATIICHQIDRDTWRFQLIVAYTALAVLFAVVYIIATICYHLFGDDIHCTYVGSNGHQVWAYMDIEDLHVALDVARKAMWILLILAILCVRPSWPLTPVAVYAGVSLFVSQAAVQFTAEWASLWCWANFVEALWYLCTYPIASWIMENVESEDDTRLKEWLLYGTKQYLVSRRSYELVKDIMDSAELSDNQDDEQSAM